jgi:hypothetical protein
MLSESYNSRQLGDKVIKLFFFAMTLPPNKLQHFCLLKVFSA